MDWSRKHLVDLSGICKRLREDHSLTENQRRTFAETYTVAKQITSFPNAGGVGNVTVAISMMCSACQGTFDHQCAGRNDWRQSCRLMHELN